MTYTMAVCLPGDELPNDVTVVPGDQLTVLVHEVPVYTGTFTEVVLIKFAHMEVAE